MCKVLLSVYLPLLFGSPDHWIEKQVGAKICVCRPVLFRVVGRFKLLRIRSRFVPNSPTARLAFDFKWWCFEPALETLVMEPATAERARREFTAESRFAADTTFRTG